MKFSNFFLPHEIICNELFKNLFRLEWCNFGLFSNFHFFFLSLFFLAMSISSFKIRAIWVRLANCHKEWISWSALIHTLNYCVHLKHFVNAFLLWFFFYLSHKKKSNKTDHDYVNQVVWFEMKRKKKETIIINKTETMCTQYDRSGKINLIATLKPTHKITTKLNAIGYCQCWLSPILFIHIRYIHTHQIICTGNGSKIKW